jgi:hypothetical protein
MATITFKVASVTLCCMAYLIWSGVQSHGGLVLVDARSPSHPPKRSTAAPDANPQTRPEANPQEQAKLPTERAQVW